MALVRWNPWSMDRFFEDDFDLPTIPGISSLAGQGLNLYETDNEIIAEAAVPGISEDNIDITIDKDIVHITGSQETKSKEGRRNYMSSLSSSFNYSFRLPQGVIQDQEPDCSLQDGILTMSFHKMQKTPPKKISVKSKSKEMKSKKDGNS